MLREVGGRVSVTYGPRGEVGASRGRRRGCTLGDRVTTAELWNAARMVGGQLARVCSSQMGSFK